ncbi:ubiquitin thioesterase OTU1 [Nematocida sp. LUAm3]|nr:ubiquitin thioesterase OTU1 [Nematocida sp. LUAm3]KAI5175991.1 ubiquitin thioesterase OTU1 [Nematocida sp. LUAm2]KAI5179087.1 ubiquitin thioesterase OTU1 [Nematocida sp. LUAm1]
MKIKAVYGRESFVCEIDENLSTMDLYRVIQERVGKKIFLFKIMPFLLVEEEKSILISSLLSDLECLHVRDSPGSRLEMRKSKETEESSMGYGEFELFIAPSDNSCLFHSLSELFNAKSNTELRRIVGEAILGDPKRYEGYLEMDPFSYSKWIVRPDIWGGATEIGIIARMYETMVCVIDASLSCYYFEEDYRSVVYLMYTGTHYNGIIARDRTGKVTKKFPRGDKAALQAAKDVIIQLGNRK